MVITREPGRAYPQRKSGVLRGPFATMGREGADTREREP